MRLFNRCGHWNQFVTTVCGVDLFAGTITSGLYAGHDIVINLVYNGNGLPFGQTMRHYYWGSYHPGSIVDIPTRDGYPPAMNRDDMMRLTELLLNAKHDKAGERFSVFCGCIGGHGRTGTMLAALVWYLAKECGARIEDPIGFVRKNYCELAIETTEQLRWLGELGIEIDGHYHGGYECGLLW